MRKSEKIIAYTIIILLASVGGNYFTPKIFEGINPIGAKGGQVLQCNKVIKFQSFLNN